MVETGRCHYSWRSGGREAGLAGSGSECYAQEPEREGEKILGSAELSLLWLLFLCHNNRWGHLSLKWLPPTPQDWDLEPMTAPGPWLWPELSMAGFFPLSYDVWGGYGGCSYVSFPSLVHNGVASQAYFTTEAP
jgi:hypothetical protein